MRYLCKGHTIGLQITAGNMKRAPP